MHVRKLRETQIFYLRGGGTGTNPQGNSIEFNKKKLLQLFKTRGDLYFLSHKKEVVSLHNTLSIFG